jgi:basic membrane lipoprotein Med (substrate-binding protein (PBP1-ABC) superfamily)
LLGNATNTLPNAAMLGELLLAHPQFAVAPDPLYIRPPDAVIPTHAATPNLIGIAYDIGGRGDSGFNDAAGAGVDRAIKELGVKFEYTVTLGTQGDRETRLQSLVDKSANPIIAIGSDYAPAVETLSDRFPNTQFILVDDASVAHLNVTSIIFAETQGAYLAGAAAALASKSGKVAISPLALRQRATHSATDIGSL